MLAGKITEFFWKAPHLRTREGREVQGSFHAAFLKKRGKHHLLCGFPEQGAAAAAKGSPLLPPRRLAGRAGKAGICLDTSVRRVWREVCPRRRTKMFHKKLVCIYLALALWPINK